MTTTKSQKDKTLFAPKLRFGDFTDSWKHVKLSYLLKESKKRNTDLKFGKDRVLSVSGKLGVVNQISHLGRSYAGESVHNYHVVENGEIVYTKSPLKNNPYGIIKLNKGDAGIVSTLYAVYRPITETCYAPFLDHYFSLDANTNRYLRPLVKIGAKNDMKINNEYVLHDKIYTPSIEEQKKIAVFIDLIDLSIQNLQSEIELLKKYKKGLIEKIFSQKIRFKDKDNKEFPAWHKKTLGEMGSFYRGHGYSAENVKNSGLLVLRSTNIQEETLVLDRDLQFVDKKCDPAILLKKDDLVICMANGSKDLVGKTAKYIGNYDGDLTVGAFCAIFRSRIKLSEFLFQTSFYKKYLHIALAGTNINNLKISELSGFKFNIPSSTEEQEAIASFLQSVDSHLEAKSQQLKSTLLWKHGLMQKLFI